MVIHNGYRKHFSTLIIIKNLILDILFMLIYDKIRFQDSSFVEGLLNRYSLG